MTIEHLLYRPDGSMQPVVQTEAGISQPPPALTPAPPPVDRGRSDERLRVVQFEQGYPQAWPGRPALASVTSPFDEAPDPIGFNHTGGISRITQTFTPTADLTLGRISLYAGDGQGTQPGQPLRLALLDLGTNGSGPGASLLGGDDGLALAYEPQGPGLLHIDLVGGPPVLLKAGRRYALELRAAKGAATIYARVSRRDVYTGGEALVDGRPLLDKAGKPVDLGFALYAREP